MVASCACDAWRIWLSWACFCSLRQRSVVQHRLALLVSRLEETLQFGLLIRAQADLGREVSLAGGAAIGERLLLRGGQHGLHLLAGAGAQLLQLGRFCSAVSVWSWRMMAAWSRADIRRLLNCCFCSALNCISRLGRPCFGWSFPVQAGCRCGCLLCQQSHAAKGHPQQ